MRVSLWIFKKALRARLGVGRPVMVLVKLGGSVITEKTRLRTARNAPIRRLARELMSVGEPFLDVPGVGSYSILLASRYHLYEFNMTLGKLVQPQVTLADA